MAAPTEARSALLAVAERVVARYPSVPSACSIRPLTGGLINATFAVGDRHIVQRLNPIFPAAIHGNIEAVTRRLVEHGVETPLLARTSDDALFVDLGDDGVWRMMNRIEGENHDVIGGPAQAEAAADLVGRWHGAVDGLQHEFVGMRVGVHDTPKHIAALRRAIAERTDHPSHGEVASLGKELLAAVDALPPLPELPDRICHGDLKFSNIMFRRDQAVALIDLDTVGPMPLAHELGDAWRSWCNPAAEDAEAGEFDLGVFEAAVMGYRRGRGQDFDPAQRRALVFGVEWISVELAIRFAADALVEGYFGWDTTRFSRASEHHLLRARGQLRFHRAAVAERPRREAILARH